MKERQLTAEELKRHQENQKEVAERAAKLAKTVVVNNDMYAITILIGGMVVPTSHLKWRKEYYSYQHGGETYQEEHEVLTLQDISNQLEKSNHRNVITVWVESPLEGTIYQFGNYHDNQWHEHGTTRGYA